MVETNDIKVLRKTISGAHKNLSRLAKKKATPKKAVKKKSTPKHPVIKRLEKLIATEKLEDLVRITGLPKTTIGDWKRKGEVPVPITRAFIILKKYGITVTVEKEDEKK